MLKRLTRTALLAAMAIGLVHGTSSIQLARADEDGAVPEPIPLESSDAESISSYGAGNCDCDGVSGTCDGVSGTYDASYGGAGARRGLCRGGRCAGGYYGLAPCTWEYGRPDLFYNFYAPNNCGGAPAQLYVAPVPVPPLVGHTYYTYQPLMPHEFMYPHHRTYRNVYDGGRGMTRAKVTWSCDPVTTTLKGMRNAIRLPR
jgi:hypothetical protein